MKSSFLSLAILAIAAAGTLSVQSVSAQEGQQRPGARFNYAPNVYKVEQPRIPQAAFPVENHAVRHGSMPKGSNFLGLDPQVLARPAQTQVAARPATMNVTPRAFIPQAVPQVAFNPSFGTPFQATPMQAPAMAAMAPGRMAAPAAKSAPVHVAHKRTSCRHVNTAVSGRIATHPRKAQPAMAAAYAPGFGYTPGGHLPSQASGGANGSGEVHGRIVRH